MDAELIKEINNKCPSEQGIFREPYGIPTHIKEPVVYLRYETGGHRGGNCWNDNAVEPYYNHDIPAWKCLDIVLNELKPNITYLQYKEVEQLIHTNEESEYEYYGNSTEYMVKYIILYELETYLYNI